MSRKEDKAKDSTAIVTVNIDDFTRTRDSLYFVTSSLPASPLPIAYHLSPTPITFVLVCT
ncbi:hypothetical protein EMCG_08313 [[Emmonsia] crescens]|uniref:Uncharacterized protein n=1 Tax=[Emmonsia] crescens TaxID=73230 RepID=A0A0G2I628_9EURO|nr:hypothetical protein EMCG_08313 [Emmonsia crescens UAMH 3008]